ncbi:MAG: transposase [Lentisphaeria bacterium]|nr:transposase [Lentisphaeria bacterium]
MWTRRNTFGYWSANHVHPCGEDISLQDSSKLFASISEGNVRDFARLQGKRRLEKEYWAYDSTSISSYSETLKQVRYGKNKESDHLPQINLLLLFGEQSGLPFHYRKLSGNIPDVKTVNTLARELDILGYGRVTLVMDRGFYSKANTASSQVHCRRQHRTFIREKTHSRSPEGIRDYGSYDSRYGIGASSQAVEWDYSQDRPYKKDTIAGGRRMYFHVYYSVQ